MGNQKQKYGSKTKMKTNKKAGPGRFQKVIISRGGYCMNLVVSITKHTKFSLKINIFPGFFFIKYIYVYHYFDMLLL